MSRIPSVLARVAVLACFGALAMPGAASAAEPELSTDTVAQFYDVRSPTGGTVLMRRRLTTTLGVSAYDILKPSSENPNAPSLTFRARLRYDADYGSSPDEAEAQSFDRFVPGFSQGPVDLMYGYVEGRRFLGGYLGFKVGRQYITDALGWWSFDGALARVNLPFWVTLEGYGGLEQRGGLPLSQSRYEREGIWRGDRAGFEGSLYPSFQPASIAPAYGVALESSGFTWLHSRLDYRRVYNTGSVSASQFGNALYTPTTYDGSRVSSERIGYAVEGSLPPVGGVKLGAAYDFYVSEFANIFGSLDWYASKAVTLSLDYDYYRPTFDADSIWNFFQAAPMNDLGLRAAVDVSPRVSLAGGAHVRVFREQTEGDVPFSQPNLGPGAPDPNYYAVSPNVFNAGGNLAAKYRWGDAGNIGLRGNGSFGKEGDRVGADAYVDRVFETRYLATGRAGVWQWKDKLREDRDATSLGYVVGGGYLFSPKSRATLEFEHNVNRLAGQRMRLMLWLTLAVVP